MMDPLVHGVLLGVALLMVTVIGALFLQEEGKRRYVGILSLVYVASIVILAVLAAVGL